MLVLKFFRCVLVLHHFEETPNMIRPLTEVNGHYYGLFQLVSVNVCFDSLSFIFDPE